MLQLQNLLTEQLAFRGFQLESSVADAVENGSQVVHMLIAGLRENDNIVQIREADAENQALKHIHHQALVCRPRVAEAELHLYYLVQADMRDKCRLLDICRLHRHLIICHREVERGKHSRASECVERFIEARQREAIKFRNGVESGLVDAHAPAAIVLAHHHDRRCPRRC